VVKVAPRGKFQSEPIIEVVKPAGNV